MVNALSRPLMAFTATETVSADGAKLEKKRAVSMKIGLPGGCPTSSLSAWMMNSPQSQYDAVGSRVSQYVTSATANTAHPVRLLIRL